MKIKRKPPEKEIPLQARLHQIEDIEDTEGAADLFRRILKAQALTAADQKKKEAHDDAA